MQKALGGNAVRVSFVPLPKGGIDDSMPMRVTPLYLDNDGIEDGSFGVLMPISDPGESAAQAEGGAS